MRLHGRLRALAAALLLCALALSCSAPDTPADGSGTGGSSTGGSSDPPLPPPAPFKWPAGESADIDRALTPASAVAGRDGLAAAVLIDVSGSMAGSPRGSSEQKIVSARRSVLDIVDQFARYADAHRSETVLLGIYEFSSRSGVDDTREVIPMGPPDRARAAGAVALMKPGGETPIGNAMIEGKRRLDATGLADRHLLVITDGQNTDGYRPERVAAVLARRPEAERPSVYFVAFDITARRFDEVRKEGALVLEAGDSRGLATTLESLISDEILLER
jgi:Mg-chelatase subunit ChlD